MPMLEAVGGVLEARNQLELFETPRRQFGELLLEQKAIEVEASLIVLEWLVSIAAMNEAVHELGLKTIAETIPRTEEILRLASRIAHLDAQAAFLRVTTQQPKVVHASQAPAAPLSLLARSLESVVVLCPIEAIERSALELGTAAHSHTCRIRYEWLTAFVRRHGPERDAELHVVGRAYAEGRLSVGEVAKLLRVPESDAVALLERHGFCRTIDAQRLTDERRNAVFSMMRADRRARAGVPQPSKAMINRDVIATERIEGVDARSWVDPAS